MAAQPVPRHLKKALERLEADPARAWTVSGLASECGVGRRTLQRQFRRFIGKTPMEYVHDLRLDRARREVLGATVLHGSAGGRSGPILAGVQVMRTDFGRPSSSMRFRTATATLISVV